MLSHRIGKFAISAFVAVVTAALPLAIASESAQAGPSCYGYYKFTSGQYKTKYAALNAAINGWSGYVASHYGRAYSYWNHASYPSTGCDQYDYYWVCWAKAQPCYWAPSYKSYKPSYHKSYGGGGSGY
jgi:hypothetical protein